jgi:DNA-binding CsgD family transcriptional regulator
MPKQNCPTCGSQYHRPREDNRVRIGRSYVTLREHAVLRLYAAGHKRAAVARKLGIHIKTVDSHLYHLMARFNVDTSDQVHAVFAASQSELRERDSSNRVSALGRTPGASTSCADALDSTISPRSCRGDEQP